MGIKFEIDSYNSSALRHIGTALLAIATDIEAQYEVTAKDCVQPALPFAVPAATPEAFTDPQFVAPPPPAPPQDMMAAPTLEDVAAKQAILESIPAPPPVIPQEAEPVAPAGPQLDSAGIPWDARIHAASKTTCKDGSWKLKPGMMVSDETRAVVAAVTAELKGVQALPVPVPVPPPAAPTLTVVLAPPAAPPAAPSCPPDFASFIKEITGRITLGQLTPDQVNGVCQTLGLDKCNLLAGRPDLIPAVWAALP